jgi:shikimate dehydrogenase
LALADVKSIAIANRHAEKSESLIADLNSHFPHVQFFATDYHNENYHVFLSTADLVVNTTSVGLKGEKLSFFPLEHIKAGALIFDMIYSSSETPLSSTARSAGFLCADGRGMLAAQGEDAFYLWTGIRLPAGYMRQILESG